jgi:crotonobetainyl-CoA:carnitine CoA-transferase CaiB-like acyl-CoA transferase
MVGATIAISALQTSEYFGTGQNPRKLGSAHPRNAPYQAYKASDGWFAIAAGNNKLWRAVCQVIGVTELMDDPRFTTPTLRAANQVALKALLDGPFAARPLRYWLDHFAAAGVPSAPINGYAEALADPQTVHLQLVRDMTLPNGSATRTVGSPIRINGEPISHQTRPPALGEDTDALRATFKKD